MSNDYGQSKAITDDLIGGIQRKIKADQVSEAGGTVSQVADAIMAGVDWAEMAKSMSVVLSIKAVADLFRRDFMDMRVVLGYQLLVQKYLEHPLAVEFGKFIDEANTKTVRDLFEFVMSKEESSNSLEVVLASIDEIDYGWFVENVLPLAIAQYYLIVPNKAAYEAAVKKRQEDVEKTKAYHYVLDMPHKDYVAQKKEQS